MPTNPIANISSAVTPSVSSFQLTINNLSGLPKGVEIFILAMGINPNNPTTFDPASQSYIRFDDAGIGKLENVTSKSKSEDYSRSLSSFKQQGNTVLQIPIIGSGRMYLSLNAPMHFEVATAQDPNTKIDITPARFSIADSDPWININNSNYYIIYDKVEFSFIAPQLPKDAPAGTLPGPAELYINTTAVDFFALPISLEGPGADDKVGITEDRDMVIKTFKDQFGTVPKLATGTTNPWNSLFASYFHQCPDNVLFSIP